VEKGARKTREWKTRHQMTGVENAGVDNIGAFEQFRVSHESQLRTDHPLVGLSVCRVYCGKFDLDTVWVLSGVSRGMGVLDGAGDCPRDGAILGVNLGHPIVTTRDFVA